MLNNSFILLKTQAKQQKMKDKKAIEFSFAWLFAVIIGAVILVLAIYIATKMISTGETETGTATAKEIGTLLNPIETGFEEGKSSLISLTTNTRIYNKCTHLGDFGSQGIQTSQKSFGKWSNPGFEVSFQNKYIFSDNYEEGKEFYLFSKPFDFPFKISDLIYLTSSQKKYCFSNPPEEIKKELTELKQGNLLVNNCSSANIIKVCFGSEANCNINVKYNSGFIQKNSTILYFATDALMYAAIFADKEIYECQAKRLMKRASELSSIYEKKAVLFEERDCSSDLDIGTFRLLLDNYRDSSYLGTLSSKADEIKEDNDMALCKLW
jgi:hypothetical protein